MPERVAFIGLGIMGAPMAGHLLKAGHPVTVHTRTQSRAEELLERGASGRLRPPKPPRIRISSSSVSPIRRMSRRLFLGPAG